ncbi:MAG TPA: GPW/gp25 family protein [Pyrinomonadaceae bacterium]|nr:GPW/gp25 family protein [Pyrinomonadaceae bacterium]
MPKSFLGRGWKFPVRIDPTTGRVAMSEMEQDIKESILILLSTAPGERLMRPEFGCGIHDLVFSSMSTVTMGLFESRVREAINEFEARVDITKLEVFTKEPDKGKLEINLTCRIRDTNSEFNLVFPFYLTEGAG